MSAKAERTGPGGEAAADDLLPPGWDALARAPSPWLGFTLFGLADRTPSDRLRRLLKTRRARAALAAAAPLDAAALERLIAVARINADQAEAAFRRTFIFNISAPIATIAAAAQVAPEMANDILTNLQTEKPAFWLIAAGLFGIAGTVYYAYAKARGARDVADVLGLAQARERARPAVAGGMGSG